MMKLSILLTSLILLSFSISVFAENNDGDLLISNAQQEFDGCGCWIQRKNTDAWDLLLSFELFEKEATMSIEGQHVDLSVVNYNEYDEIVRIEDRIIILLTNNEYDVSVDALEDNRYCGADSEKEMSEGCESTGYSGVMTVKEKVTSRTSRVNVGVVCGC